MNIPMVVYEQYEQLKCNAVAGWWWHNKCSVTGWRVSQTVQAIHRGRRSPAGHCEGISTSYQPGI